MKHYFFRAATRRTHAFSMPVALLCALFLITGWRCEGQAPGQPVKSPPSAPETPKTPTQDIENWHSSGRFFGEEKDLPKGVISETHGNQPRSSGTSGHCYMNYSYLCVKNIYDDESKNKVQSSCSVNFREDFALTDIKCSRS